MSQSSRYSDQQIEMLLMQLANVLDQEKAPLDLSLMVLGNMITDLINSGVSPTQRHEMATTFSETLLMSIKEDSTH